MTLQQMEYIVALNKYRQFVLAAESCGITQPTLSAMIQKLENELEVKIFNRDKKNISPTRIGEKIILQAQIALNEANRIKEIVLNESNMMNGPLNIGIIPTIAPYLVPSFINFFKRDFPDISLYINEMTTKVLIHELELGTIDLGIAATPIDNPKLLEIPIYYERFVAYFSNNCKKANIPLTPQNLPSKDLWILQQGHCLRNQVFNFCQSKELGVQIYEAGSIDTLIKIVDKNGGYTIIPQLHLPFLNESQLKKIREINNPPAVREISILIKEDFIREKMINAVADTIKKIIPLKMVNDRLKKFAIKL